MLRDGRERCRRRQEAGSRGSQMSTLVSDLYDDLVLLVWNQACQEHFGGKAPSGLALVAHGGFGRRDLAPFSDADLMLIVSARATADGERVAQSLSRDLVDIGLEVGFSMRRPGEACALSWSDPVIFTSLTESRFLAGSLKVFSSFFESLRHGARRRSGQLIRSVIAARREEKLRWGDTSHLLTPNIKKSRGGLRDIQMMRWIGFARFGEVDLERLLKLGALSEDDYREIRRCYEFLIRLRNELHVRENRAQDVLDRPTQLEIAEAWGYKGSEGMLPVEAFMQEYFDVSRSVRYIARFFADDHRARPIFARVMETLRAKRIGQGMMMGPEHVWVEAHALPDFVNSLPSVLRLMSLANLHGKRIQHHTWQAIRTAMQQRKPETPDAESVGAFLSLLSKRTRLAPLLRRLHELRIIEQLIPEFKHCRGLLQFNAYHKYTVDAHSIRAVEAVTEFADDQSAMGRRYRRLKDKTLLHLALLIHDIGKGYEEDHSIVGARMARAIGERFDLDHRSIEILEWLVLKHLAANTVAFRHDLSDPTILLDFAKEVGSIRRLELLIVHSVADLAAVGPGVLTDWKLKLMEDLYLRTRRYFEMGDIYADQESLTHDICQQVELHLPPVEEAATAHRILHQCPLSLLRRERPEDLAQQLLNIAKQLDQGATSVCYFHFDPIPAAIRYVVIHRPSGRQVGVFARMVGAFMACGIDILRAEIMSVGDLLWDEFWVSDPDHADQPPPERIAKVTSLVEKMLADPAAPLPERRRTWSVGKQKNSREVQVLPTKVVFDNETLDRYTILSVFAYDESGLLYRIASNLADLGVDLHFAKIDTHLDQIADVFYVTEENGQQISRPQRQEQIRERLLNALSDPKALANP